MKFIAKSFQELTTTELYEILKARTEIFVVEQQITYQDMDDVDYRSLHCFLQENNTVIAYLRAYYKNESDGAVQIGRVLTLQHGKGIGKKLMEESMSAIHSRMKCSKFCMEAQKYAIGFYEKLGFQVTSEEFMEAGIVHVAMELVL